MLSIGAWQPLNHNNYDNAMNKFENLILPGNSVVLRRFERDDITSSYLSWLNDPVVTRFSNQRYLEHTQNSAHLYLDSFHNSSNVFLSIRTKNDGVMIGTITAYIATPHNTADMGILLGNKNYWGLGLGQQAWNTLGNWLIESVGIRKITGGTVSKNLAMIKIMENFGMFHEATRSKQQIFDGIAHDVQYYSKFNRKVNDLIKE